MSTASSSTTQEESPEQKQRKQQVQKLLWDQVKSLMTPSIDLIDLLLLIQLIAYVVLCPYTKVEESFNTQATHDLLFHSSSLYHFDHFEFPGVVPRTFLGPVFLFSFTSIVIKPLQYVLSEPVVKHLALVLMRVTLGLLCIFTQAFFRNGMVYKFRAKQENSSGGTGYAISMWYAVFVMCQFHLLFYVSRPLPNIFALVFVFMALGYWLRDQYIHLFAILGVAAVIFRSDLFVFIVPIAIVCLVTRRIGVFKGVFVGLASIVFGIGLSLLVDSYFWQRIVWPEGEVFYYNTALNKSHEWGVQSPHWYFSSALPRALLGACVFIPFGVLFHKYQDESVFPVFLSSLLFVALYSLLPHKELRFIFYAIPVFNLTAAIGIEQLRRKIKPLFFLLLSALIASFILAVLFFRASSYNYYGGDALNTLYKLEANNHEDKYVHLDVHVTMNGFTRFQQYTNSTWKYSKQESNINIRDFTHMITGRSIEELKKQAPDFEKVFEVLAVQEGYEKINFKQLSIVTVPKIKIYKRRSLIPLNETQKVSESELIDTLTKNSDDALGAPLKWCQRNDRLLFTINLPNVKSPQVYITRDKRFIFRGTSNNKDYLLDLLLYDSVEPQDYTMEVGARYTKLTIMKSKKSFWTRLLAAETKLPYVGIDWDNWVEGGVDSTTDEVNTETDDATPHYMRQLKDGHGTTLNKFIASIVTDKDLRDTIKEEAGNFLDTLASIYCPPFIFALLVTFICGIIATLFHMTSVVEFLVRQHSVTLNKVKEQEQVALIEKKKQ
jgi:alpha-1,6-mannosyltransferase